MARPEHGPETGAEGEDRRGSDEEAGEGRRRRGIELSVAQVAGAGVATLTAATAASYLNVYGTVIGTAVMAVLSTSVTPVIQHWITRSGEQAKEFAEKSRHHGARTLVERPEPAMDVDGPSPEDPEATRTMALPSLSGLDDPTSRMDAVGAGDDEGDFSDLGESDAKERPKRGLRAILIPAGVVFVLVMLVILAFELFTGRSLTAWTQGQTEHTSPSILGGHSAPAVEDDEDEGTEAPVDDGPGKEEGSREQGTGQAPPTETTPEQGTGTEGTEAPDTDPGGREPGTPEVPTDPVEPPGGGEPTEPREPVEPGTGNGNGDGGTGEVAPFDETLPTG